MEFVKFNKIPRLSRQCIITEKIDGTNGCIAFTEEGELFVGSRKRWITPGKTTDNFGFAEWAYENAHELWTTLGPGRHYGEWWGKGIQRGYGIDDNLFSLFNVERWSGESLPKGVVTVPVLYQGIFTTKAVEDCIELLELEGSIASPGYKHPEGVVIYHLAAKQYFKKTLFNDEVPKKKAKGGLECL